jgi:hypothetical protein
MEHRMKYVCLVYLDDDTFAPWSELEHRLFINEALDSDDALRASGNYVDSSALEQPSAAVSVRVRDGKLSTTDGPFAETKEHLSGFIIVEARDLNDAIRLAGNIPMARLGTIEVRPVRELERYEEKGETA